MGEDNQNFFDITLQPIINDTYLLDFEQQLDELSKKKIKISAGIIIQDDAGKKKTDDAIKQIRALSKFDKKYDTQASIKIDVQGLDKQIDSVIEKIKNIDKEIVFKPKIITPDTSKQTSKEYFIQKARDIGGKYRLGSESQFDNLENRIDKYGESINPKNFVNNIESMLKELGTLYNYSADIFNLIEQAKESLGSETEEFKSFMSSIPEQKSVSLKSGFGEMSESIQMQLDTAKDIISKRISTLAEKGFDVDAINKQWEKSKNNLFSIDYLRNPQPLTKDRSTATVKQAGTFNIDSKSLEGSMSRLDVSLEQLKSVISFGLEEVTRSTDGLSSKIDDFSSAINDKVNRFVINSDVPEEWKKTPESNNTSIRLRTLFNTLDKNYQKVMESNDELQKSVGKNLLDITDEQLNAVYETYNSLVDKTVTLDFNVLNSEKISEVKDILLNISKLDKAQSTDEEQEPEKKAVKRGRKSTSKQVVPSTEEVLALRSKAKTITPLQSDNIPKPSDGVLQQSNIAEISELYNKLVDKVVTISIIIPEENIESLLATQQILDSFKDKVVDTQPKKVLTKADSPSNKAVNNLTQKIELLINTLSDKMNDDDLASDSVLDNISNTLDSMLDVQTQIRDYIYNTSNFSVSDLSEQSANSLLDAINSFSDKISSMDIGDESIQKLVDAINQNNTKTVTNNSTDNPVKRPASVNYNRTDTSYRSKSISSQAQSSADTLSKVISGKSGFSVSSRFINKTDIKSELDKLEQIATNAENIKKDISLEETDSLSYNQLSEKLVEVNNNLNSLESELSNTTSNEKISRIIDMANAFDELNNSTSKLETKLADIRNEIKKFEDTTIDTSELSQIADNLEDRLEKANNKKDEIKKLNISSKTDTGKYIADMNSVSAKSNKAIESANKRFESIMSQINERKTLYDMKSGDNEIFGDIKKIQKLINSVKSSGIDPEKFIVNEETNKSLSEAETLLNSFKEKLDSIDENTFDDTTKKDLYDNYITPIKELMSYLDAANEKLSNLKSENKYSKSTAASVNAGIDLNKRIESAKAALIKWGESNNKALRDSEFKNQYDAFLERLNSGTIVNATDFKKYNEELQIFKNSVVSAGKAGKTAGNLFLEMYKKFGGWTLVTKTMGQVIRLLKDMYTQTRAVDTAMTNLRKVTDASNQELNKYLTNASSNAIQIGVSLTDYIDATSQFSRLGYNLDQSEELGNLATIYKTVAEDLDINTASQSIISTLNAYKNFGIQAQEIVDQFNYVGNNFSISSAGIGEALQRSAASLAASNTSLTKSIALITAGNTIVQDVDKMGTQLKTISARIRGATSELGEDSEEIAISTSKLQKSIKDITGVDIMVSPTQFKDIYQIFDELSMVWDKLEDTDQAAIAEMLGGKTGLNVVQAIISNFQTARDVYTELEGGLAEGSATKELETALDSVDGKLNQLTATWQKLSNDTLNSEAVKGVIDSLRTLLSILDGIVETSKSLGVSAWGLGTFATTMIAQNVVRSKTGSGRVKMFTLNKYARISPGGNTERVYSVIVL